MTPIGTSLVKYRLSTNIKIKSTLQQKHIIRRHRHRINLLKFLQTHNHHSILGSNNRTMSKAFIDELDFKMQQIREYNLIRHGYHNENIQYPIHVRRSHDGEKLSQTSSIISKTNRNHRKNFFSNTTILTPSSHDNLTKVKSNEIIHRHISNDERHTTLIVPPNKTINDIDPSLNCNRLYKHRKSSTNSSRPRSVASISLPTTDEQQINSLSNSSQTLINQSVSTKTLTQRFLSKFFHHPSKS
ncbi:unnamed protein product [Rotaria sordida]|uniref:Uncharacterized protein n=1 Tax=Rotaria sordida TaxID=392033 RepID=A0A818RAA0_9BILA|nr:unnamed protein product [Rotaria sordida]CAF1290372.1 unnamed protein product [Rotaria sordida]CAF1319998.1 unnamed protein product [Rotaria sordida]CAF3564998.1 unnamed protein product [Rotaria sordida]CAF3649549.1 unnamed protein product [Rotaria sordida]